VGIGDGGVRKERKKERKKCIQPRLPRKAAFSSTRENRDKSRFWNNNCFFTDLSIGYRIKKNQDYGTELALGNSVMLAGSAIPRIIKTGGRSPVPIALGATGALATWYYQKKVREFRYGV